MKKRLGSRGGAFMVVLMKMTHGLLLFGFTFFLMSGVAFTQEGKKLTWQERWAEDIFDRVDLNDDGHITQSEAKRTTGAGTEVDVHVSFHGVDRDGDGKVSREEFLKAVKKSKTMELITEDRDSDLGQNYRPKAGRENTQDVGLRFKF